MDRLAELVVDDPLLVLSEEPREVLVGQQADDLVERSDDFAGHEATVASGVAREVT